MANNIQIKRSKVNLPEQLLPGQMAHTEATQELYIGNFDGDGNLIVGGNKYVLQSQELTDGNGSPLRRAVRVEDLIGKLIDVEFDDETGEVIPADEPHAPLNVVGEGFFTGIKLTWDAPTYNGHAYAEVWRNTTNTVVGASLVGQTRVDTIVDTVDMGSTYFYWVRFVNQDGINGPFHADNTEGTEVSTSEDIAVIIDNLTDEIDESMLKDELNARLDKIDTSSDNLVDALAILDDQLNDPANGIDVKLNAVDEQINNSTDGVLVRLDGVDASLDSFNVQLNDAETGIQAQIDDANVTISDLNTQINDAATGLATNLSDLKDFVQDNPDSLSVKIADLEETVNDEVNGVSANATAISGLDTRVSATEGTITAQATEITNLETELKLSDNAANLLSDPTFAKTIVGETGHWSASEKWSFGYIGQNGNPAATADADGTIIDILSVKRIPVSQGSRIHFFAKVHLTADFDGVSMVGAAEYDSDGNIIGYSSPSAVDGTPALGNWTDFYGYLTIQNANAVEIAPFFSIRESATVGTLTISDAYVGWVPFADNTATSSAFQALDSRVVTAEGTITSQGTAITALENDLTTTEGNVSANATAISGLNTRVTATEGTIATQSTDITQLQNQINSSNINLMPNFNYEGDYTDHLENGVIVDDVSEGVSNIYSGAHALKIADLAQNDDIWRQHFDGGFPEYLASQQYTIGFWAKSTDNTDRSFGYSGGGDYGLLTITANSDWTWYTTSFTVPTGFIVGNDTVGDYVAYKMLTTGAWTGSVYIDRIVLLRGSQVIDGNDTFVTNEAAFASSSAIDALNSRVTANENTVATQASQITQLETDVSAAQGDADANSTAISGLDSRVTSAEGTITAQGSSITQLESDLTTLDGQVGGNTSAISSLSTRMSTAEGTITTQSSDITSLENTVSNLNNGDNLLVDPGFEKVVEGETTWSLSGDGSYTYSNQGEYGGAALKIIADGTINEPLSIKAVPVKNGEKIYLYARAFVSSDFNGTVYLGTTSRDSGGTIIGHNTVGGFADSVARDTWVDVYQEIVISTGENTSFLNMRPSVRTDATTGYVIFDYIYMGRVPRADNTATSDAFTGLDSRVTATEGTITSQASEITNLQTDLRNFSSGDNMFVDPSFDKYAEGNTVGWNSIDGVDKSVAYDGEDTTAALTLLGNSTQNFVYGNKRVTIHTNEKLYVYARVFVSADFDGTATFAMSAYDDADNYISYAPAVRLDTQERGKWVDVYSDITFTQPNAAEGNIRLGAYDDATTGYVKISYVYLGRVPRADNTATSDAFTGLDSRVTAAEGSITSQASEITQLQSDVAGAQGDADANASAIGALDTRVTATESSITSQASEITQLQSDVSGAQGDADANASAIGALDTRVTATESSITSQASEITELETSLGSVTTLVDDLEFNQGLEMWSNASYIITEGMHFLPDTTHKNFSITPEGVSVGGESVWHLTKKAYKVDTARTYRMDIKYRAISDGTVNSGVRLHSGFQCLDENLIHIAGGQGTHVWALDSGYFASVANGWITRSVEITGEAESRTNFRVGTKAIRPAFLVNFQYPDAGEVEVAYVRLVDITEYKANSTAISSLDTRVTSAEGSLSTQSSAITTLQNAINDGSSGLAANASAISTIDTRVTANESDIDTQASAITALENTVNNVDTGVEANATAVSAIEQRLTDDGKIITVESSEFTSLNNTVTISTATPLNPAITSLVQDANLGIVTITVDTQANDKATRYEIWNSFGDESDYAMIAEIPKNEVADGAEFTVTDETITRETTVYYKVFAVNRDIYSTGSTNNINLSLNLNDVTNLTVTASRLSYDLTWDNPEDQIFDHVEIRVEARVANDGGFVEGNGTLIYSGKATSFVYEVPVSDQAKFHKFWVKSVARN